MSWVRTLPGSSQVVILIGVTAIIKYHDKALILPEFLFMKTAREVEIPIESLYNSKHDQTWSDH